MTEMVTKRTLFGTVIATFGFLLSPLSWWNDIVFNIPLSYLAASAISFFIPGHFALLIILCYWSSNVAGLLLMHKGGSLILGKQGEKMKVSSIIQDLAISLGYSVIIAILVISGVLKLPAGYFGQ